MSLGSLGSWLSRSLQAQSLVQQGLQATNPSDCLLLAQKRYLAVRFSKVTVNSRPDMHLDRYRRQLAAAAAVHVYHQRRVVVKKIHSTVARQNGAVKKKYMLLRGEAAYH